MKGPLLDQKNHHKNLSIKIRTTQKRKITSIFKKLPKRKKKKTKKQKKKPLQSRTSKILKKKKKEDILRRKVA